MIGTSFPASICLICRAVSNPSSPGICTSIRITSMWACLPTAEIASSPEFAESNWYSSPSSASRASRFARLSSTSRTIGLTIASLSRVALAMSPSPGGDTITDRLVQRLQPRHHAAREALHAGAGEIGRQRAELAQDEQVAEAQLAPMALEGLGHRLGAAADEESQLDRLVDTDVAEHLCLRLHHVLQLLARCVARRQQHLERHLHEYIAKRFEVLLRLR